MDRTHFLCMAGLMVSMMVGGMAAAGPLDDYRWKNRLVVASFPDGAAGQSARQQMKAQLEEYRAGFQDRDMLLLDAAELGLRDRYSLSGEEAEFVLIGKDGGEKDRQTGNLDLQEFFVLIDTMPMRKREMRESS